MYCTTSKGDVNYVVSTETNNRTQERPKTLARAAVSDSLSKTGLVMPRERRSKGTKTVRSEDDRPLYMQHKAQAEAELARKKEEILTYFLRDKLQDDERNTALNLQKLNDGWRSILRQSKSTEIKEDIDVLHQTFERQLDGQDSIMKNLEVNVKEAESQAAQLHRTHQNQINKLLELQKKRMDVLEQRWESTLEKIKNEYTSQREQMSAEIQQQHTDIEDNSLLMQHKYDEMMSEITAVYRQVMDFYENLFLDKVSKLEKIPEERLKEHQQLMQEHSARRQELESLIKENQEYTKSIQQTNAELQRLQAKWFDLQLSLSLGDNGLSKLQEQLTATTEGIKTLRTKMEFGQSQGRKRLIMLTVNSDKATKKLLSVINKGDRILRLAKLCKKLEDKLLISEQLETPPDNDLAEEDEEPEPWKFPELKMLIHRQNSALLQREALRRRRDAMRHENVQLHLKIQKLRQRQETMTVSGRSLPKPDNKKGRTYGLGRAKPGQNPPQGGPLSLTGTQVPIAAGRKRL